MPSRKKSPPPPGATPAASSSSSSASSSSAVREVKQAVQEAAGGARTAVLSEDLAAKVDSLGEEIARLGQAHHGELDAASRLFGGVALGDAEAALVNLLDRHHKREVLLAYKDGALLAATIGPSALPGDAKATAPLPVAQADGGAAVDLSGAVITHTHPEGSPLSKADVSVAVDKNLLEIRATGPNGTFSLKRPPDRSDWGYSVERVVKSFATGMANWSSKADLYVKPARNDRDGLRAANWRPKQDPTASKQGASFAEDNCMQEHFAALDVARQCGAVYTGPSTLELAAWRLRFYERRQATGADKRVGFGGDYVDSARLGSRFKEA